MNTNDTYTVSLKDAEIIRMIYTVNSATYKPVELLICRYGRNQPCTVSIVFDGGSNRYLEQSIDNDNVTFTFKSSGVLLLTSNLN